MIAVGQTVGNYKITAKLGEGGMGVVYLAEHPVIGRKVAMKAIHPELSRNPEVISRFVTEAKSVNQIGNEHIVDINDFGNTADGEFYFVMEFLQGESLADRLKRERALPAPRALKIAAQVADALAASHEHGIIHRDLKPENIYLITRGTNSDFVKVLDFGLAKLTQGEEKVTHKTRTGSVMGTPYYMSPEQCEGKPNVDHRADIYSLGVILFEMLTGKVPFGGEGYGEIIVKHITQPPPSVKAINPLLTDSHESLVLRSLAKNRDERFQTMGDFRTAILDPEGFHATQPARPGAGRVTNLPGASVPSHAPDDHPSAGTGQIVFGEGADLGARPAPMPTTFRTNAGELIDDGVAVKSRKGLVFGVVGAAAVAGLAAFFMMRGRAETPPPVSAAAVAPTPAAPTKPELPEKVKLVFHSEPKGASVIRLDTKEALGTTPLDIELPYGKQPIDFKFQKAGYQEKQRTVVPQAFTQVDVELDEVEQPAAPDEGKRPSGSATRRPRPTSGNTGSGRKSGGGKGPVDEDAVLAPSF